MNLLEPPVPAQVLDDADAPLPEGEVVVLPAPLGQQVILRFPSAFEPMLLVDDIRILDDTGPAARRLLLWLSRRLPALSRALSHRHIMTGVLHGTEVLGCDVWELEEQRWLDHGALREMLEPARVTLPSFGVLGRVSTRGELMSRVRGMYAAGTTVELRVEDDARVVSRRHIRVGR